MSTLVSATSFPIDLRRLPALVVVLALLLAIPGRTEGLPLVQACADELTSTTAPSGFRIAPHRHPDERVVTVLSGPGKRLRSGNIPPPSGADHIAARLGGLLRVARGFST